MLSTYSSDVRADVAADDGGAERSRERGEAALSARVVMRPTHLLMKNDVTFSESSCVSVMTPVGPLAAWMILA